MPTWAALNLPGANLGAPCLLGANLPGAEGLEQFRILANDGRYRAGSRDGTARSSNYTFLVMRAAAMRRRNWHADITRVLAILATDETLVEGPVSATILVSFIGLGTARPVGSIRCRRTNAC